MPAARGSSFWFAAIVSMGLAACAGLGGRPRPGGPAAPAWTQTDDGSLLLVYEERAARASDIYFARVEENAELEGAPRIRLDADEPGASESIEPRIAANAAGLVLVVWQDLRGGVPHLRLRRSTDGGRTWPGDAIAVSDTSDTGAAFRATLPSVAVNARGDAWIAWEDRRDGARDIFIRRSTSRGWAPSERVESDAPGAASSFHPQLLAPTDDTLLLLWWDERSGLADLYVRRSTDGGVSWAGPEERLDPGFPGKIQSHAATLVADEDLVIVTWKEGSEELVRTSADAGATWSPPELLSATALAAPQATRVRVRSKGGLRIEWGSPPDGSAPEE